MGADMKSHCLTKLLSLQCATALASMGAVKAIAADVSVGEGTLMEIIVTADKRRESINDVPMSISAVTGDQLAERGINSAADLQKVVSGFRYTEGENGTPVYSIRGVGFNEPVLARGRMSPSMWMKFRL